jgi:hypothetical protein
MEQLEERLPGVLAYLSEHGVGSTEALVEVSELVGTRDTCSPAFRAGILAVASAYGYPRGLPVGHLPNAVDYSDSELALGDIQAVETWTENKQVRWALFYSLRRIKGSMNDLRLVRFPKAWLYASQRERDDAFPVGSRALYGQVKAILDEQVWSTAIGHSSGKHAAVYWVTFEFDPSPGTVERQEAAQRWGQPYGFASGTR